jgi:type II secretory pathway pseudopilin PulG
MAAILPKPADREPRPKLAKSSNSPKVKRTMLIMVSLVILALLCLLAGYLYDVAHTRSQDDTRKQDLSYIASAVNDYYKRYHYYPTLNQINSPSFQTIIPTLDRTKFSDPSSTNELLLALPGGNGYAYEVDPRDCNNGSTSYCTSYKLVAILSSDKEYEVMGVDGH